MTSLRLSWTALAESAVSTFRRYQPLRFLIVGGFNTSLCYVVYAAFVWLGLAFWLANLCSLLFGIGLGFLTQGRFVFKNRRLSLFWRFLGSWLLIYLIQTGAIGLLMRSGIDAAYAGLIVLPGTAVASYVIQKRVFFRRSSQGK